MVAPASLFLTVHPSGSKLVADLVHAGSDTPVAGPAPTVTVDTYRRQIEVDVPHQDWNPGQSTVRMAMGVGLWNAATGKYLLPGPTATATQPGGAGIATNPAGFFNVAFRTAEPFPSETAETGAVLDAAWWRDQEQGTALAQGNISPFYANVNFAKLPSIVITPEARGPDQEYEGLGAADVFEAWAEIASLYPLNPAYTDITGYSMGGIGTFKLGAQFPDLFARAQPTVGFETNNDVLASLRNLPVLMWNVSSDELVNASDYAPTAAKLASLGYRYELDVYQPCANSLCSPVLANHLMLGINDQFAPAAAFLGSATVDPNPAHVTYVVRHRPRPAELRDRRRSRLLGLGIDPTQPQPHEHDRRPRGRDRRVLAWVRHRRPDRVGQRTRHRNPYGRQHGTARLRQPQPDLGRRPPGSGERHARRHRDEYRDRLDRRFSRPCGLWRARLRHDRRADHDRPARLQPHDPSRLAPARNWPLNTTGTP